MQSITVFTKSDLAKYPFLKEAAEYVKGLDFKVEDLVDPHFNAVLKRAQERIEEAILYVLVSGNPRNEDIEILSFPTAIILAIATENAFIKKRYAVAEAKKTFNDLKLESKEKILAIARNFGWQIAPIDSVAPYEFSLNFANYLRNTTHLRDKKWKLVNRLLSRGNVFITRGEAARLLSEEVRRYIEKRLEVKGKLKFPARIVEIAEKMKKLSIEKVGEAEIEGLPKTIVNEAFPPCIEALYEAIKAGRHLSHVGRFTLTSFLINIGMPIEHVIDLFRNFSDFNERMSRYQVEHIAGERGSRTRYTPPKCETLQTHGVCVNPDDICKKIRHPLAYYSKKSRKS